MQPKGGGSRSQMKQHTKAYTSTTARKDNRGSLAIKKQHGSRYNRKDNSGGGVTRQ